MSILSNANAMSSEAYVIGNSLRFQSASSQYLSRTPSVAGNRQKFTFSFWVKRGALSASQEMYFVNAGGGTFSQFSWTAGNALTFASVTSSVADIEVVTAAVFRDPSAWYHVVLAVDTTQATALDRVKIYVNNNQLTYTTTTLPALNYNCQLNNTVNQNIGRPSTGTFDGYMAEFNFIDGQALTPSSFGYNNPYTGVWVAEKYTGSYGTNGFYLPFSNGTSTATLGVDYSGNNNNWNLNAFTRSAGVSDCWMKDVPTGNGYRGLSASSNYATLNPINVLSGVATITAANLNVSSASANRYAYSTIAVPSTGSWYAEATCTANTNANKGVGFWSSSKNILYTPDGRVYIDSSQVASPATYTTNDVIGMGFNAGVVTYYKNGVLQYTSSTLTFADPTFFYTYVFVDSYAWNFGQRSFAYTPPTGFLPLCVANLPVPTILQGNKFMDATLYTGTSANATITNAGAFKPDLVWIKSRSGAYPNVLMNSIAGANQYLMSNSTNAEATFATGLTSFNSNGFGLGADTTSAAWNYTGVTYVGWQWQAGQGSTSSNTNGTITSTVSVNATAGFSVVTYTGTGANATVGHGLGVAPKMVIVKARNNADSWLVYNSNFSSPTGDYLILNSTAAKGNVAGYWNGGATSTVFGLGAYGAINGAFNYVAYCFAEIAGYSKFGSYTGNGSTDGPMVYLGFQPKYWLVKRTDGADDWFVFDSAREPSNSLDLRLSPNASYAEASTTTGFDFLANGVKVRSSNAAFNASGGTYIYMAFAENPFNFSNAR